MASRKLPGRLPLVSPAVSRLSVPSMQPAIYVPPPAEIAPPPPPPTVGGDDSYESSRVELAAWPGSVPQTVYTTKRRWRRLDVYVQPTDQNPAAGIVGGQFNFSSGLVLSVFIFAVNNGIRTCVASGRRIIFDYGATPRPFVSLIASTAVVAERFEVVTSFRKPAVAAELAGGLLFNVIGSNEAGEPNRETGVAVTGAFSSITSYAAGAVAQVAPFELVRLSVANGAGVGVARWLHVHDTLSIGSLAGLVPMISVPVSDDGGPPTVLDMHGTFFVKAPRIVTSSTALTTTETADCAITAWVR